MNREGWNWAVELQHSLGEMKSIRTERGKKEEIVKKLRDRTTRLKRNRKSGEKKQEKQTEKEVRD